MTMSKFKAITFLLAAMALASCSSIGKAPTPSMSSTSHSPPVLAQQSLGDKVVADLNRRYMNIGVNCGSDSKPAFLCNGVLIRGTRSGNYHVWNNTPISHYKGGVSFSYLRQDVIFSRLAYNYSNGYIFKPILRGDRPRDPSLNYDPDILCSFAVDGWTDSRAGTGCGAYPNLAKSDLCRIEGITDAAEWHAAYGAIPLAQLGGRQCGFDVDDSRNDEATVAFANSLLARVNLGPGGYQMHNEMILGVWPENTGRILPLEAFFYIEGSAPGLAAAKLNQTDLKVTDNVVIPIIKVKLPTAPTRPVWTINAPATFEYVVADQAEPVPVVP